MNNPLTPVEEDIPRKHRVIITADGQCIVAESGYAKETIEALLDDEDWEDLTLSIIEMTDFEWSHLPEMEL